jgi:hypothetical protein
MSRRLSGTTAGIFVLVAAFAAPGCRAEDPCAPAGAAACGGDPSGNWTVRGVCQESAYTPPQPLTYLGQPSNTARQPPPEATSSDWCSYLVYDPVRGITNFVFPYDTLELEGGTVTYEMNGIFSALMSTHGGGTIDLSGSCLTRFAAAPSCETLTTDLQTFAATEPSFQNIACTDDGAGGCRCSYTINFLPSGGSLSGRWGANGSVMTHFAGSKQLPSQVDYCLDQSDTLTLWGRGRTDIWDQPGLRTLILERLP